MPVLASSWATWVHILEKMGHSTMAMQTQAPVMIHSQTDSRGQNERARKGFPEASSVWPTPQNVGGGAGGQPSAPPPSRQWAEVTQPQSHFRRAETRKKLGAAEARPPPSRAARVPRGLGRAALWGAPAMGAPGPSAV